MSSARGGRLRFIHPCVPPDKVDPPRILAERTSSPRPLSQSPAGTLGRGPVHPQPLRLLGPVRPCPRLEERDLPLPIPVTTGMDGARAPQPHTSTKAGAHLVHPRESTPEPAEYGGAWSHGDTWAPELCRDLTVSFLPELSMSAKCSLAPKASLERRHRSSLPHSCTVTSVCQHLWFSTSKAGSPSALLLLSYTPLGFLLLSKHSLPVLL